MNKVFLTIAAACLFLYTGAQTVKNTGKNEAGVNLFSLHLNPATYDATTPQVLNGLFYKHAFKKLTVRAAWSFARSDFDYTLGDPNQVFYSQETGVTRMDEFRLGIEKGLTKRRWFIYAGTDFIYRNINSKGRYKGHGDWPPYDFSGTYNYSKQYTGLSVFTGLKYAMDDHVMLTLETSLEFMHYVSGDSYREPNFFRYVPVKMLAVSYRFGK